VEEHRGAVVSVEAVAAAEAVAAEAGGSHGEMPIINTRIFKED
jgi:hypothetical protein